MLLLVATSCLYAQTNGTNSPYSRFGLGLLKERSQGFNKGMGRNAEPCFKRLFYRADRV